MSNFNPNNETTKFLGTKVKTFAFALYKDIFSSRSEIKNSHFFSVQYHLLKIISFPYMSLDGEIKKVLPDIS